MLRKRKVSDHSCPDDSHGHGVGILRQQHEHLRTTTHNAGTPAGTYRLTVTATSVSITHTVTSPLTVS